MVETNARQEKKQELLLILFLNFIFWPVIAILVVSGYGFVVWISQWFFGPPGPL